MSFAKNTDLGQDPSLDEVFYESYNNRSGDTDDSDNEDELGNEEHIVGGVLVEEGSRGSVEGLEVCASVDNEHFEVKLGITEVQARANYLAAGIEVAEEEDGITVAGNSDLINSE